MAHFAKLENGIVTDVVVVNNADILVEGVESEQAGIDLLTSLFGHADWKQTSYNNNIRKNYAGIGYSYDDIRDAFIPAKPFASWILNEETCLWEPPTPRPEGDYVWNEETLSWDLLEG